MSGQNHQNSWEENDDESTQQITNSIKFQETLQSQIQSVEADLSQEQNGSKDFKKNDQSKTNQKKDGDKKQKDQINCSLINEKAQQFIQKNPDNELNASYAIDKQEDQELVPSNADPDASWLSEKQDMIPSESNRGGNLRGNVNSNQKKDQFGGGFRNAQFGSQGTVDFKKKPEQFGQGFGDTGSNRGSDNTGRGDTGFGSSNRGGFGNSGFSNFNNRNNDNFSGGGNRGDNFEREGGFRGGFDRGRGFRGGRRGGGGFNNFNRDNGGYRQYDERNYGGSNSNFGNNWSGSAGGGSGQSSGSFGGGFGASTRSSSGFASVIPPEVIAQPIAKQEPKKDDKSQQKKQSIMRSEKIPECRKCWPGILIYLVGCKLQLSFRQINQITSDLFIVPYKNLKFDLYGGNIIQSCSVDYQGKIQEKQKNFEAFKKRGNIYYQKCVGNDRFIALAFMKIEEGKEEQSMIAGLSKIVSSIEKIPQPVKSIVLPICPQLGAPKSYIHHLANGVIDKIKNLKSFLLITKDPVFFIQGMAAFATQTQDLLQKGLVSIQH